MELLKTEGIVKKFGGLTAVNELCLNVDKGEICALIGPNGSGKTTALNLITGIYEVDGGKILFKGQEVQSKAPFMITQKGIARTFQNIRILESMSVFDNARLGTVFSTKSNLIDIFLETKRFKQEKLKVTEEVDAVLEFVGLKDLSDEIASNLPYGKKRALEIARALVTKPDLLLLDEPAAGLNTQEVLSLMALIKKINQSGITIFLVEHRMELVGGLADRVFVLNYGKKICEGPFCDVKENAAVIEAYLGKRRKV
jgi:branched-chain amino acid transport system ATP-binding protein